jgi:(2Fe-2S) ferredoxin
MEKATYRAYLCCGPNCGPKGSGALLDFLSAQVESRGLEGKVTVAATGCQAHCESGPTMVVFPGPTYYQQIDRERLTRIVVEHFIADRPVADYFWTGVRKRIIPGSKIPAKTLPMPAQQGNRDQQRPVDRHERVQRPPREVDDFKW